MCAAAEVGKDACSGDSVNIIDIMTFEIKLNGSF